MLIPDCINGLFVTVLAIYIWSVLYRLGYLKMSNDRLGTEPSTV